MAKQVEGKIIADDLFPIKDDNINKWEMGEWLIKTFPDIMNSPSIKPWPKIRTRLYLSIEESEHANKE